MRPVRTLTRTPIVHFKYSPRLPQVLIATFEDMVIVPPGSNLQATASTSRAAILLTFPDAKSHHTLPDVPSIVHLHHRPAPGICPDCIMAAFCSWNRCPSLSVLFMYLSTQRMTHPSSFECSDLVVKSLTQSSKHLCTRFEYVYSQESVSHDIFVRPYACYSQCCPWMA